MAAGHPVRRAQAFGITLETSLRLSGVAACTLAGARTTRIDVQDPQKIEAAWPREQATVLLREGAGPHLRTIEHHPAAGYRFFAGGYGRAVISANGRRIMCARDGPSRHRFERFLVGRVLPWAAVIHGLEVFHASALAVDDRGIALLGPTGAGKSSLAARLVLGGARLLTDDALALELNGDSHLLAHPGTTGLGIRPAEQAHLTEDSRRALGGLRHADDGKAYATLPASSAPVPLVAAYFLTRSTAPGPLVQRLGAVDPAVVLGSTFVASLQNPQRLRRLLEVCSRLTSSTTLHRVRVLPGIGAAELGAAIDHHVRTLL